MSLSSLLLLSTAAIILGVICSRSPDDRREGRTSVLVWVMAIGAWPVVVAYLVAPVVFRSAATPAAVGSVFSLIQYLPAIVVAGWSFGRAVTVGRVRIDPVVMCLLSVMALSFVSIVVQEARQVVNLGVAGLLLAGFLVRWRSVDLPTVAKSARIALATLVAGCALATLVTPGTVIDPCRQDKCNLVDNVLTSPFAGNGNFAGLAAAVLFCLAVSGLGWIPLTLTAAGAAIFMEAAASRTAVLGVAVAFAIQLAFKLVSTDRARRLIAVCGLTAAAVFSLLPFYTRYIDGDFAFRGQLWSVAKHMVVANPILGHGPLYWQSVGASALYDANYSPHNGWLEVGVALGLVGCVGIITAVVLHVITSDEAIRHELIAYYAVVLTISTFEAVYVPYYLGIVPAAALLPLTVYQPTRTFVARRRHGNPQPRQRTVTGGLDVTP
ncbi:O-antigen ligase family protein [Williamsia serinedens]|uniref:O-antigen ligase like membrane protein n=1 Tax=Williamsia serinedens TaxID=391736 RepID=A0ABT1H7Y7_9NOCA|nr:O-antigen ligase family protein [Williamsia serinedens]MCP2161918.1 O-antigen ligase like membrane protein [Williamsia serinedens]